MPSATHSFGNLGGDDWSRHWTGKRQQMFSSLGEVFARRNDVASIWVNWEACLFVLKPDEMQGPS